MFSDGVFACSSCCHIFRHAPSILHGFIPFAIITLRAVSMKMVNIICILSIWLIFQALALSLFHRKQHKLFTILSYRSSINGPNIVNHCQLFFRWQWTPSFGGQTIRANHFNDPIPGLLPKPHRENCSGRWLGCTFAAPDRTWPSKWSANKAKIFIALILSLHSGSCLSIGGLMEFLSLLDVVWHEGKE